MLKMVTIPSFIFLCITMLEVIDAQGNIVWTNQECRKMMETCELSSGLPGLRGPVGLRGEIGQPGSQGPPGDKGFPGVPGDPPSGGGGFPVKGPKGEPGESGAKGPKGLKGSPGNKGDLGVGGSGGSLGLKGDQGERGNIGPLGQDGDPGITKLNWKQCLFRPDINMPSGELTYCTFLKERSGTSLHVTYQGETHIGLCDSCCKTWYFTFDNLTCTDPGSIDAVFSALQLSRNDGKNTLPVHMHGTISGYCNSVPRGSVRVGLSLDDCAGYPSERQISDSVISPNSRIIIQEVPAPQY